VGSTVFETVALLETLSPTIIATRADEDWGTALQLSHPSGADYEFLVYLYPDGEPQIGARLVSSPTTSFWSQLFETPDFSSPAEQLRSFHTSLTALLTHATRITYRRGLLLSTFLCEAESQAGWQRVGGTAGFFRFGNFRLPRISGCELVWKSPPPVPPAA
jgi:hypothetical protein